MSFPQCPFRGVLPLPRAPRTHVLTRTSYPHTLPRPLPFSERNFFTFTFSAGFLGIFSARSVRFLCMLPWSLEVKLGFGGVWRGIVMYTRGEEGLGLGLGDGDWGLVLGMGGWD